jgi:hypothetical protein
MAAAVSLVVPTDTVAAGKSKPKSTANSGPTRMFLFNMRPGGVYSVKKNDVDFTDLNAGPVGTMGYNDDVTTGDVFRIVWTDDNPVVPGTPTGLQASGNDLGCATLTWDTPGTGEYVYEYMLAWGPDPGTPVDSALVSMSSVSSQGGVSTYSHCGLPDGRHCFMLRAHNSYDLWSSYSSPACADVSGGDPQGPPAPGGVAVVESDFGCATVSWNAVSDPSVSGYVVYFGDQSVTGGQASAYDDSLDVGDDTNTEICGFSAGNWYFAVKSYTGGGIHSGYSSERTLAMVGVDVTAPNVYSISPPDGATDVSTNASVFFSVSDAQAGVDSASITVTFNGTDVGRVNTVGGPAVYAVVAGPNGDFAASSSVDVEVKVSDLATPPNQTTVLWSFETGAGAAVDTDAPVFAAMTPENGSDRAEPDTEIRVNVTDGGLGVDISSVEFYVNDAAVTYATEGDAHNLTLVYENDDGFTEGDLITVRIVACDLASPPNCAELSDYSFSIKQSFTGLPSSDLGVIVPNGFWANDPTRPLEVRDMPVSWTVRIFDTAGRPVRSYTNNQVDGQDWMWDFTNDHGQRVARAMYLVRVTDVDGSVRQSGRFLVQADP